MDCPYTAAQKSFDQRPRINTQLQLGVRMPPQLPNRFNGFRMFTGPNMRF
jgi:hypothetical protein